jgi:hypothetical protein
MINERETRERIATEKARKDQVRAVCAAKSVPELLEAVKDRPDLVQLALELAHEQGRRAGYSDGYDAAHQDHVDGNLG